MMKKTSNVQRPTSNVEVLLACPTCGTRGFTARGLKAHRCDGVNRNPSFSESVSRKGAKAQRNANQPEASSLCASAPLREVTLAVLDSMPDPAAPKPIAITQMSLPQLAEAYDGLDRLEKEYENMSGICATLKGLVLIECKTKPELKGRFKEWVTQSFPKSYKTATRYMHLAEAFGKSDSTGTFLALTRDLSESVAALREFQLDLKHPVVSKVAQWVAGRGAYQLMLDLGPTAGKHHPRKKEPELSPEEQREVLVKQAQEWAAGQLVDDFVSRGMWKLLPDHEAKIVMRHFERLAKDMAEWIKTPPRRREQMAIEEVLS